MMTRGIKVLTIMLITLVVVDLCRANWETATVDQVSTFKERISIALDSNHLPRLVYGNDINVIKCARYDGGTWQLSNIASGRNPAMAIGADDRVHVIYTVNKNLYYAVQTGINWTISVVDTSTYSSITLGTNSSIVIDKNGYPHLAYRDYSSSGTSNLKYARWDGNSWSISIVDSGTGTGDAASLAIGTDDKPRIVYYDYGSHCIKYAVFNGSGWDKSSISSNSGWYIGLTIKVDSNNVPHVIFFDDNHEKLKYAKLYAGTWSITDIDSANNSGAFADLSIDAENNLQVSYCKYGRYYARWTGSSWIKGFVDHSSSTGGDYTAITVDNNNNAHIASFVFVNGAYQLRYYKMSGNPSLSSSDSGNVNPASGTPHQAFTFGARYFSSSNEPPASGFPQVIIKKGSSVVSRASMQYQSGDYATGAIFSTSTCMPMTGSDYSWLVIAFSSSGAMSANNLSGAGPSVSSPGPVIEPGFASGGLNIENGFNNTIFTYRILYRDIENDMPKSGYPKLHILKNDMEIEGSPFAMSEAGSQSSRYDAGRIFEFSRTLNSGNYSYYTEAYDVYDTPAAGGLCSPMAGPQVADVDAPVQGEIKVLGSVERRGVIRAGGDKTLISFQGSQQGTFRCRIFNTEGELLFEDVKYDVNNGFFEWIPKDIASGIYIARVEGPGVNVSKKIAILR